jgi:glyoxylase-like metal-dependent hydrolase (beta-lactamase superfamily II)
MLFALFLFQSSVHSSTLPSYETVKIADGVVAFIASESNNGIVSGNCVAIIGDDGVLVVDSTSFPSHARKIIAELKKLTNQPVRFLVHTHWHPDHLMGDGEFQAAFPGIAFVSTKATRKGIAELAPKYIQGNAEQGAAYAAMLRKQIQDGKDEAGKTLTDADKKFLTEYTDSIEFAVPEYKQYKTVLPNAVFDDAMTIHLGKREVQLLFLGQGNTAGDAVIFVPDAKVVMTGDLLVAPTPYSYGSFLTDWVRTLDKVKALGATTIVPGHGPVEHDSSYLDLVSSALQSVIFQVHAAIAKHLSLEDTRKQVDVSAFQQKFCGGTHDREVAFRVGFAEQAVERAYQEAKFLNED